MMDVAAPAGVSKATPYSGETAGAPILSERLTKVVDYLLMLVMIRSRASTESTTPQCAMGR